MFTVKSATHDYSVEEFASLAAVLDSISSTRDSAMYLVDRRVGELYQSAIEAHVPPDRVLYLEATEEQKSLERLTPIFLGLLDRKLRRDGRLVIVGGGVLQDIGCFIATVLFRGIDWDLVPTTLLAQADSCIGSKSSINIGAYKNQIGTFYSPRRILLTSSVLLSLPHDEIRSGFGEIIKLQLLAGETQFRELMQDLARPTGDPELLRKWVARSLEVKKEYIELDEFDRGVRNLLNYGHTFGHAYESASQYAIPHGIAVLLGIVTAASVSAQRSLVSHDYARGLRHELSPWYQPFDGLLKELSRDAIFQAVAHDKKNTGGAVNCILTRGAGAMERMPVALDTELVPAVNRFIDQELI